MTLPNGQHDQKVIIAKGALKDLQGGISPAATLSIHESVLALSLTPDIPSMLQVSNVRLLVSGQYGGVEHGLSVVHATIGRSPSAPQP